MAFSGESAGTTSHTGTPGRFAASIQVWIYASFFVKSACIGITFFSGLGVLVGAPLPNGMQIKHLVVAGIVAGLGLTVALFVAGEAFPGGSIHQGPAKMGAVFSAGAAFVAFAVARAWGIKAEND